MNNKVLIIIIVVVVIGGGAAWFFTQASEEVAEEVVENALESATNGAVDVDVDDETVSINVNGGSFQVGEEVDLPADFPSDVYVADGTIKSALTLDENGGFSVTIESTQSVSSLKSEYEAAFADDGWDITATLDIGGNTTISAEKGNRMVTVSIADVDGTTNVALNTSTVE